PMIFRSSMKSWDSCGRASGWEWWLAPGCGMDEKSFSLRTKLTICIVLGISATMIVLVALQVPGVNGPWYWKWQWRRLPVVPYWPLMCAGAAPIFAAIFLERKSVLLSLGLMMLGAFVMKFTS